LLAKAECGYINRVRLLFLCVYKLLHHSKKLLYYISKNLNFGSLFHVLSDLSADEFKNAWVDYVSAGEVVLTVSVLDLKQVDHGAVHTVAGIGNLLDHVDD
jgi:hypothetical protein